MKRTVELTSNDRHKSFYKKALLHYEWLEDGTMYTIKLQSYFTIVAEWDEVNKTFTRQWSGYSATTMRHINAFMHYLGFNVGGKSWWTSLPVGVSLTMHDILNAG